MQLLFFFRSFLSLLPLDNNNEMDRGGEWVTACRPAPGWRPLVRPLAKRSAFNRPISSPLVVIRLVAQRCTPSRQSCANRTVRHHLSTTTNAGLQALDCFNRPCTLLRAPSQAPRAASPASHYGGSAVLTVTWRQAKVNKRVAKHRSTGHPCHVLNTLPQSRLRPLRRSVASGKVGWRRLPHLRQ